jgi:hypothetical protein
MNTDPVLTPSPLERVGVRLKIAYLTPEYPHPKTGSSGGIGTSIKNLALGLLEQGCSVRVLVYGQKEDGFFDDNGITVQQIRNVKFKGLSWWLTRKKLERIINQLHSNQSIDLVEAPDWTGITSFIQPEKCPIVIRLNGSDTYFCHLENRPVKWNNKFHERRALQKADGLISVSQFTADLTNEVFGLQKKFAIIPNSIDIDLFDDNSNNNSNENDNFKGKKVKNNNEQQNLSIPSSPLLWRGAGGEDWFQVEAFESSSGKNSSVPIAFPQFLHSGIHVSTQINHSMIWIFIEPHRLTTQTSCGDCSVSLEKIEVSFVNQNIQDIGPFENGRLNNPDWQSRWHVFHRMHGNVHLTI